MQLIKTLLPFLASSTLVAGAVLAKPVVDSAGTVEFLIGALYVIVQDVGASFENSKRDVDPVGSAPFVVSLNAPSNDMNNS